MEWGRLVVDLPAVEFSQSKLPLVRAYRDAFSGSPDTNTRDANCEVTGIEPPAIHDDKSAEVLELTLEHIRSWASLPCSRCWSESRLAS